MYIEYDERLIIGHILLNCSDLVQTRGNHFTTQSLRVLFEVKSLIFLIFFLQLSHYVFYLKKRILKRFF